MHHKTITEILKQLRNKKISSVELTQEYLKRINKFDKKLNAFITVCEDTALKQARAADERREHNETADLLGIPIAQKDIFCTKEIRTSCGSRMLDNFISPYDATVISKFNRAGAIMLGKTNMDEFAMGSSNENSYYGPVKNPWDLERIPGGSSGGSAAAVAARLAPAATGTDTGGSIRQPAAFCGITGIKPTYGRVSRYGMVAFASSLDQGGVMAHTAEDAALILKVMSGHDPHDSTSSKTPVVNYREHLNNKIEGMKIGLPKEYFQPGLDSEIEKSIESAKKELEKLGAVFVEISLPNTDYATSAYYVIAPAECSSNLARYDGVRYGYRCENPIDLDDMYKRSRTEAFGDEVKRRIMTGTYVLSSGYYDAYYTKAQKIRRLIRDDFLNAFKNVDCILTPTTPTPAFKIGEKCNDPVAMYLSDTYTIALNLAGLPGMSIPCGFTQSNLPIGFQLIGKHFDEATILNVAHQYQSVTDWHNKTPEGF